MFRDPDRPRNWEELRQRVLDEDYLSVAEMQERRQKLTWLKRAPWIFPVLVLGLVPSVLVGAAPWWLVLGAFVLGAHGAYTAYGVYRKYDPLWDELIAEKRKRDALSA